MASLPLPLPLPLLNEVELQELINHEIAKLEVVRRDLTRKYREQIAEQEVAFRQRLFQFHNLHPSSQQTQHEVLQPKRSRRSRKILQAKPTKKLHQESSRSLDSGFPECPGWCSLCEVDCITQKVLKKHISGKKHQTRFEKSKHGYGDGRDANSQQQSFQEEQQQKGDIIDNPDKREKQMKEGGIPSKKLQQVFLRSPDSRFPKRPGWCSLCELDCNTESVLKKHILGKKHQSMLQNLREGSGDGRNGNSNQQKSQAEHEQQVRDVINNLDKREKKMKEGGMYREKMQQDSLALDSGLPKQPGWCSLCEVDCNTEKDLNKHILGKKHQSTLEKFKQGSGDKGGGNSNQQKSLKELPQQNKHIIDNLHKRENQIKEGGMYRKTMQQDSSSLDSRSLNRLGWCSLCGVDCNTDKDLEKHILGKKHQSTLKTLEQDFGEKGDINSKQQKSQTGLQQQDNNIIDNLDKQEKKMKEGVLYRKKMQQDNSGSLDSGLSERPGWCSLFEVGCNTDKGLEEHILGKKHQSRFKKLKEGSGDKGGGNSMQVKSVMDLEQQDKHIIVNLDKQEKQMKETGTYRKMIQQDNSGSLDSGLTERPGWCSLCEVGCNTDKDLEKHILGKKHQSTLKFLKQGSQEKGEENSKQQRSLTELQQQDRGITGNIEKLEKQMKEGDVYRKKMQQDSSRSPDSGFLEQPGWCSLCEVECYKEKVLEVHILGKKHQSKLKMLKQDLGEGNSKQVKSQAEQGQQDSGIVGNLDKREKQTKEGDISSKKHKISLNSNQLTVKRCVICRNVFNCQADFELHLAGREHATQLKKIENSKTLSEIQQDGTKCAIAGGEELTNIECVLPANDSVKNKLVWNINGDRDIGAKHDKFDMKENADRYEQQQIKGGGIPSEICKMPSNSSQISKEYPNTEGNESGSSDYESSAMDDVGTIVGDKTVLDFEDDDDLLHRRMVRWQVSSWQGCAVL